MEDHTNTMQTPHHSNDMHSPEYSNNMQSSDHSTLENEKQAKMIFTDDLGVDEPQHWPVSQKLKVSAAAFGYTFALLYGATAYTTGIQGVMAEYNVSMTKAVLPFSLYIWGIMFAPLYSPHVSEKFGRNSLYMTANILLGVFTIGAAYSQTYTQLAVLRFFAGLTGGSAAVQVEGTFADVWPRLYTNSYYVGIAGAQFFGAATGAIVGWHVVPTTDWRWSQYTSLMFILAALLLGLAAPESYRRELVRRRAKALGQPSPLEPALSGTTFAEMAKLTIVNPPLMFATQPVVTLITLYLALSFGVTLAWFIVVPFVLENVAKFTPQMVGSAFATAIGGTAVAIILIVIIDQITVRAQRPKKNAMNSDMPTHAELMSMDLNIETRLYPAMFGALLITVTLFWVGWTANPHFLPKIPIIGNGLYVTGSVMVVLSFVTYLFDAYRPQGTLSALTAAAVTRLAFAGIFPLVLVMGVEHIGGQWTLSTLGFISIAFLPFPFLVFVFGKRWRMKSTF